MKIQLIRRRVGFDFIKDVGNCTYISWRKFTLTLKYECRSFNDDDGGNVKSVVMFTVSVPTDTIYKRKRTYWLNPFSLLCVRPDFDWVHKGGPRANLRRAMNEQGKRVRYQEKPRSESRARSNHNNFQSQFSLTCFFTKRQIYKYRPSTSFWLLVIFQVTISFNDTCFRFYKRSS